MSEFESVPNLINNLELNPSEVKGGADVEKKPERELTLKEQHKNLEGNAKAKQQEITRLTESIRGTKVRLNEVREKLGLPPDEEDPPSVLLEKEKLEKLQSEQQEVIGEKPVEEKAEEEKKEVSIKEEIEASINKANFLLQEMESTFLTNNNFEENKARLVEEIKELKTKLEKECRDNKIELKTQESKIDILDKRLKYIIKSHEEIEQQKESLIRQIETKISNKEKALFKTARIKEGIERGRQIIAFLKQDNKMFLNRFLGYEEWGGWYEECAQADSLQCKAIPSKTEISNNERILKDEKENLIKLQDQIRQSLDYYLKSILYEYSKFEILHKEDKPYQEVREFLEGTVFSEFDVTKEREKEMPEIYIPRNWSERKQRIEKISYKNIRKSLQLFFEYYHVNKKMELTEIHQLLQEEMAQVKNTYFFAYNINESGLEKALQSGHVKSIRELPPEQQKEASKSLCKMHYLLDRIKIEQFMGIDAEGTPDDPYAISCCLCSVNGFDERNGGTENYGDIFFILKKKQIEGKAVCTEGDSMNHILGTIAAIKAKKSSRYDHELVQGRQVSLEHALISKTIYNLYFKLGGKHGILDYIEAQIGGVSMNDVESINYPKEFKEKMKEYEEKFPQYAHLFKPI